MLHVQGDEKVLLPGGKKRLHKLRETVAYLSSVQLRAVKDSSLVTELLKYEDRQVSPCVKE